MAVQSIYIYSRGTYLKFTSTQQAQVAKYTVENGNQTAIRPYAILIAKCQVRCADVHSAYKIAHVKIFSNSAKIKTLKFILSRVLRKFLLQK